MTTDDIPTGLALCRTAGWNQLAPDWRRLLALQPAGCFVAEVDGRPVGTVTTTAYGTDVAWIGMVLVDPAHRRRGVGSALLEKAIDHLRAVGVAAIKLDATDVGRPVYQKLGFEDEYEVRRYVAAPPSPVPARAPVQVRPLRDADWPAVSALDHQAFGTDRTPLLRELWTDNPAAAAVATDRDRLTGFGLARPGHEASYIGPIVAEKASDADALLAHLINGLRPARAYLDPLAPNLAALALADNTNFVLQRRLTRMFLGANHHPGTPHLIYAASSFETG